MQSFTEKCGQILCTSYTHIPKQEKCPYQHVSRKITLWVISDLLNCCYQLWCWWLFDRSACFATSAYRPPRPVCPLTQSARATGDAPLAVRARMYEYMHDGAPTHCSQAERDVLNNSYHDWWIDRGGPTAWPSCSLGLNPLDFDLWGH
jgi:hypothetical protein